MATRERPLSPHLQVYRWQITMTMSILHRATGVGPDRRRIRAWRGG